MEKEFGFTMIVSALGTCISCWLGGWDVALRVLIAFMVIDYVTGFLGAVKTHKVDSEVMFWGGIRKGVIIIVITIAVMLDQLLGDNEPIFRMMALYFYIAREGLSIAENFGILGVPFPEKIKKVLVQLQEKGDEYIMLRITLNAGHGAKSDGSYDSGALGTKVKEAWQNIEVAKKAKIILEKDGHTVQLVQDGDLIDVIKAANSFKSDFFVSVHCNSAADKSAHGVKTYCYAMGGKGEKLARSIQTEIVKATGLTDRGVKTANFCVLRKTDAPAVLTEMAFISNPVEEKLIMSEVGDNMFATAIVNGILKVF